jgi:acetyl/propionyl-CoA carboxylase alpha subunit
MFKITVNTNHTFEFSRNNNDLLLNGEPFGWDVLTMNDHTFHILKNNQSYTAEVLQADYSQKHFIIKVNGNIYKIEVKDRFDLLLEKLGMSNGNAIQVKDIKAPMPGLILHVQVTEGQEVKKGDVLVILEAMKMENTIKSPVDGKIKAVKVRTKESVEKNQVMVQFE